MTSAVPIHCCGTKEPDADQLCGNRERSDGWQCGPQRKAPLPPSTITALTLTAFIPGPLGIHLFHGLFPWEMGRAKPRRV
ncbi:hypothetical protein GCM10010523_29560 [Paenarthrobacter ilicis]